MEQDHALGPPELPQHGREEWLSVPMGLPSRDSWVMSSAPSQLLPSFAKSIQLGCASFLEQKAGCLLCQERQQLNFGPPRRGSRGAFTAGLASLPGWEEAAMVLPVCLVPLVLTDFPGWTSLNGRAWHETLCFS